MVRRLYAEAIGDETVILATPQTDHDQLSHRKHIFHWLEFAIPRSIYPNLLPLHIFAHTSSSQEGILLHETPTAITTSELDMT